MAATHADYGAGGSRTYSGIARFFHWLTVALIAFMLATGFYMSYRGKDLNIWDGTTDLLYTSHKLVGLSILALIIVRLSYRLIAGAPAPVPTLTTVQRIGSATVHWALYVVVLAMPIGGWLAISLFPALNVMDVFTIPALVGPDTTPDKAQFNQIAAMHGYGALALCGLLALHVGAALFHALILRDGVFARMWPSR